MECIERFEVTSRPTMHIALPKVFKAIMNLEHVAVGSTLQRKNYFRMVQPSIFSKLLCGKLAQYLQSNLKPHPPLFLVCYLNPINRGLKFVSNSMFCSDMRQKAEDMTESSRVIS